MVGINYRRLILALDDTDLEVLVRKWAETQVDKYCSYKRFGGKGDKGRDVVGFYTPMRHEGDWDNYQCKQYGKPLTLPQGMREIGKIMYYASIGDFSVPKNYYFVAPKGINGTFERYIDNPAQFQKELISTWSEHCELKISAAKIPMSEKLKETINSFDFGKIHVVDLDTIVNDENYKAILVDEFGGELPSSPAYEVPTEIHSSEFTYVSKILEAYGENEGIEFSSVLDIQSHIDFSEDFIEQRERFYSAEVFKCFYRDNTVGDVLSSFENEILKGIKPTYRKKYGDGFECMCAVLEQAAVLSPTGKLSSLAKIDVKQGYCHHFVNNGNIRSWSKK
ncbi:ABC-three component system protein [Vibrio paucivorans]